MNRRGPLERHWKKMIAVLYVIVLLSGSVIGYYMSLTPSREMPEEDKVKSDEVAVWVHNEVNVTRNLTVRMYGDPMVEPPDIDVDINWNITSFDTKKVEGYEKVMFKTKSSSTYDNYPFDIKVYEDGDMSEAVAERSVRLTVGQSSGNENIFHVYVS